MTYRRMDKARLFIPADDFDFNTAGSKNPVKQEIAIRSFPRRARSYCTQTMNIKTLGYMLETQESFFGLLNGFFLKIPLAKNVLTEAHRQTNVFNCVHLPGFVHLADHHAHGI